MWFQIERPWRMINMQRVRLSGVLMVVVSVIVSVPTGILMFGASDDVHEDEFGHFQECGINTM